MCLGRKMFGSCSITVTDFSICVIVCFLCVFWSKNGSTCSTNIPLINGMSVCINPSLICKLWWE